MVRPKCDKQITITGKIRALIPSCPEHAKEPFVELFPEELEAIMLADTLALRQVDAARKMGVSQSTFQRIVTSARKKSATAIVEGRGITLP